MERGYWAGAARVLRSWLDLPPPVVALDSPDASDWIVQQAGAPELLEQIDKLLLANLPEAESQ